MNEIKFESFESFKHGLIVSKLWLCEELEKQIKYNIYPKPNVYILGGWTNILSFMMLIRNKELYNEIQSFDIDKSAIDIANSICDTWKIENPKVYNLCQNVNDIVYDDVGVVINCSIEHMDDRTWFNNIPNNTLICMQSSDMDNKEHPWHIKDANKSIEDIKDKFSLRKILFEGTKEINYNDWGYKRFMIIGIK